MELLGLNVRDRLLSLLSLIFAGKGGANLSVAPCRT